MCNWKTYICWHILTHITSIYYFCFSGNDEMALDPNLRFKIIDLGLVTGAMLIS